MLGVWIFTQTRAAFVRPWVDGCRPVPGWIHFPNAPSRLRRLFADDRVPLSPFDVTAMPQAEQ